MSDQDGSFKAGSPASADERLQALEINAEIDSRELASLRASRHEQSNWLNRHNLEINELKTLLDVKYGQRITVLEGKVEEMDKTQLEQTKLLITLRETLQGERWKIGGIIAVLVFVAQQLASHIKF